MILWRKENINTHDIEEHGIFNKRIVSPAMTRTRTCSNGLSLQPSRMLWVHWMWSAITRLFVKGKTEEPAPGTRDRTCDGVPDTVVHVFDEMDRNAGDDRRKGPAGEQHHDGTETEHFSDAYDSRQVYIPLLLFNFIITHRLLHAILNIYESYHFAD